MTTRPDPDLTIAAWLDDGPTRLPESTRRAIAVALRTQPRRSRMAILRGLPMFPLNRLATGAAIVLAVGLVSVLVLANRGGTIGSPGVSVPSASPPAVASPAPSASPTPATSGLISTAAWPSFTSARYGYSVQYPPELTPTQSTRQWTDADRSDWLSPANDTFKGSVAITVMAVTLPSGTTRDEWIASAFGNPDPCTHTPVTLDSAAVDGHPVEFVRETGSGDCGGTFAFVVVGDRLYDFFIGLPGYEPTLEAFLSTLHFRG